MADSKTLPPTRVLAIASHVVYGYVGNKMATLVLQSFGCEVSAINTVNYSNHTGYKQFKGTKTSAADIESLYDGLKQAQLSSNFDVLLSGYIPSAEAVSAVGKIGRDLKLSTATSPGSFFWVLDPVLGDESKLYVPADEVPQYKSLLREADLILPNQFEAEVLSDTKITDLSSLVAAISTLHRSYQIPHIIITSLRLSPQPPYRTLPSSRASTPLDTPLSEVPPSTTKTLTIIGSTSTSTHAPRVFRIDIPAIPIFFSGTGDMFAALMVSRLRETAAAADLLATKSWKSSDDVPAKELPLASAVQRVLASMQVVLADTARAHAAEVERLAEEEARSGSLGMGDGGGGANALERSAARHLRLTRAAEVRVVSNREALINAEGWEKLKIVDVGLSVEGDEASESKEGD